MRLRAAVTMTTVLCAVIANVTAGAAQTAPSLTLKPDCSDETTGRWLVTAFGTMPAPGATVWVVFDHGGQAPVTAVGEAGRTGSYQVSLAVPARPAPGGSFRVAAFVPDRTGAPVKGTFVVAAFRVPCAPPPTTPTTAPPTTATPSTPPPTTPPTPVRTPTVLVDPALGSAGSVITVRGFDFPTGLVTLQWDAGGGPGAVGVASAGSDGGFSTQLVIFPNGSAGQRVLLATSGGTQAGAPFLIVQGTQQPARFVSRR